MKFKATHTAGGMIVEFGPNEAQLPSPGDGPQIATLPVFKLKKIIVPVDFSPCSLKALQYAAPFAKQFGAELILVHVIEPYVPVPEMGVDAALIENQLRDEAKAQIEKLRQSVDSELAPTAEVRTGSPWMEVVDSAKKLDADLIIISTHGRTGLAHLFMGSIAERIVRHASCPVLVVRENEHEFVMGKPLEPGR
jgi:universal stress protein A